MQPGTDHVLRSARRQPAARMTWSVPGLGLCLLLAASGAAEAQLFKCIGRDGKVTYQSEKCADAVRESTVRPPDPVAPRAAPAMPESPPGAAADAKEPPIAFTQFVGELSSYENCAVLVPGFGARHQANFNRWKERHRAAFTRYGQDGEAQRKVRDSAEYVRQGMNARSAEQRQYDAENCEAKVAPLFAPPSPATSTTTKN